jgi:2-polyprenyl-3-methyl-5-hydroxy-6-metoxy-1,4-benzoquinol methylase
VSEDNTIEAVRLPGGNRFNDLRIDIDASHRRFEHLPRRRRSVRNSKLRNAFRLFATRLLVRWNLQELLVLNGVSRKWLDDFRVYWTEVLGGRPLWNTIDFFLLLHGYRLGQQHTTQLDWNDSDQHVTNWQHPSHLYATLQAARSIATRPVVRLQPFRSMKKGSRVLEYGCSLGPYYHCYRDYFSHLDCTWVLADIPNYPFHYAKYLYRNDAEVDYVTISADAFDDPLGSADTYDMVILTTVLEHLDEPIRICDYLIDRLNPGGMLVFDYIKSDGEGLDHPNALATRDACLNRILDRTQIIHGDVSDLTRSLSLCIGRKT